MDKQNIYTAGGTIGTDKGIYIPRAADEKLLKHCLASDFCYVLTARQMGKSSLMVHTAKQLNEQGVKTVLVDLTDIGVNVSVDQWYFGLIDIIVSDLDLDVDYLAWWEEHTHLGETQRFTQFLRRVLLEKIDDPIVIFIDEIDTMLSLKFDTAQAERSGRPDKIRPVSVGADFRADFFAAIRAFYNARSKDPVYQRLTFVLLGVTQPTDLIEDAARTPFNIGVPIDLTDFTLVEALSLTKGLELSLIDETQVMEWILNLTGGHPYLTQSICLELTKRSKPVKDEGDIATAAVDLFFKPGSQDPNLRFVRDMLTREPNQVPSLRLYTKILSGERIPGDERIPIQIHLRLSGVVKVQDGFLSVRNKIYERILDIKWANNILNSRLAGVVSAPDHIEIPPKPFITITSRKAKDELPDLSTIALKITDKPLRDLKLTQDDWRVIQHIHPDNTVKQIAQKNSMDEFQIRHIVSTMMQAGIVEIIRPGEMGQKSVPVKVAVTDKPSEKPKPPNIIDNLPTEVSPKESINPLLTLVRNIWAIVYNFIQRSRFNLISFVQKWRTRLTSLRSLSQKWKSFLVGINLTKLDDSLTNTRVGRQWALQLAQADLAITVDKYAIFHLASISLTFLLAFFVLFPWNFFIAAIAGVIGAIIPRIYVGIKQDKRLYDFEHQLGDVITFMVNDLRAGYSLFQAIDSIGRAFPDPISYEFRRVVREIGLGSDIERAWNNCLNRIPSQELNLMITAISTQHEVGGNLSDILEVTGYVIRERIRIANEIVRFFKPLFVYRMLIIVAATMIVVQWTIFSAYFSLAWQTELGQRALLFAYWVLSIGVTIGTIFVHVQYKTLDRRTYLVAFWKQLALDLIFWGISIVIVFRASVPSMILVWFVLILLYRFTVQSRIYSTLTSLIVVISVFYLVYITERFNFVTFLSASANKVINRIEFGLAPMYESIGTVTSVLPYVQSETLRWAGYILMVTIIWFIIGTIANLNVSKLANSGLMIFYGRFKKQESLVPTLSSDTPLESLISIPADIIDRPTTSEIVISEIEKEIELDNDAADITSIQLKSTDVNIPQILKTSQEYLEQSLVFTAAEHCYWSISRDPNNLLLHRQLAKIYINMGRKREAITQYQIVARTYKERGEIKHVVGLYNRILKIAPINAIIREECIELLISLGMIDGRS